MFIIWIALALSVGAICGFFICSLLTVAKSADYHIDRKDADR